MGHMVQPGRLGQLLFAQTFPLENAQSLTPLRHLHGSSAGKEKPESICLLSGGFR